MYIIKDIIKNHKTKVIMIAIIILLIILNIYTLSQINFEDEDPIIIEKKEKTIEKIKVDIKGEINAAGIYEMNKGQRVSDLIEKAGGTTKNADTSIINLSKKLTDEMVVIIYSKAEVNNLKQSSKKTEIVCPNVNDACISEENKTEILIENNNQDTKSETKNTKISINSASLEELQTLNGIGTSKAKAIVEYRKQNGKFKNIEDLLNIKGIGESLLEKIKDNITI